jgi:hypothetical protein
VSLEASTATDRIVKPGSASRKTSTVTVSLTSSEYVAPPGHHFDREGVGVAGRESRKLTRTQGLFGWARIERLSSRRDRHPESVSVPDDLVGADSVAVSVGTDPA